ncbi:MAG: hypothetical protein GY802_01400, partial [Gammaproteobacteria bacterium]|nr:hypothetical protein [Gammaproteobacteria bacterium]
AHRRLDYSGRVCGVLLDINRVKIAHNLANPIRTRGFVRATKGFEFRLAKHGRGIRVAVKEKPEYKKYGRRKFFPVNMAFRMVHAADPLLAYQMDLPDMLFRWAYQMVSVD